jgi:ribosome-binding factor A
MKRNQPRYPRTARLNALVREIVAEELRAIDDDRLDTTTVTSVVVDGDLRRAAVYFDTLDGAGEDPMVLDAFAEHRVRLQGAIGRQARIKRTPELVFRPDDVTRGAERLEGILRELHDDEG